MSDDVHKADESMPKQGKRVSISEAPKTGHTLLTEGSVDCIALSRKGLFTAGKVKSGTEDALASFLPLLENAN